MCDVVCTGRFYDFLEQRDGRWGIVLRQPIYERDRLDPIDPAATALARPRSLGASRRLPPPRLPADRDRVRRQARHAGPDRARGRAPLRAWRDLARGRRSRRSARLIGRKTPEIRDLDPGAAGYSCRAAMEGGSMQKHRLRRVEEAFSTLPDRYLGGEEGREGTVQVRLLDLGRTWEVELHPDRCKVRTSPSRRPDVVIGTDAATWLALREGGSRASTPSSSAASGRAATSTPRSASRACSGFPTTARRCFASTTSTCAARASPASPRAAAPSTCC